MTDEILRSSGLRASYITHLFGMNREVKVVDVPKPTVFGVLFVQLHVVVSVSPGCTTFDTGYAR